MFARLLGESFARNPRRKLLAGVALLLGMAAATSTLTIALDVGDRLAREFRSFGANLRVTPQSDTLPLEIGGVDYRPVDEGAYLGQTDLGHLKTIFWRNNIIGFTPFLDVPAKVTLLGPGQAGEIPTMLIGTWYRHAVPIPDGTTFTTGVDVTHPWWKVRGRWFADGANECVVGAAFADRHRVNAGDTVELRAGDRSASVLVAGILATGGPEEQAIVVPLSLSQTLSNEAGRFRQLFVSALVKPEDSFARRDPQTMTPTEFDRWYCSPYISSIGYQIQQVLPGTEVRPIRRVAETEGRILSRVGLLMWIVTLAALTAAGLAVAATSATTVIERRSEVGLMKALGATNWLVAALFLGEQMLLAIAGGAAGYLVGIVLARELGRSVFGAPSAPRLVLLPVILALAAAVAFIGSLIPLGRAARFRPAPILRGE
jgi:putative ABC transport system permease protein